MPSGDCFWAAETKGFLMEQLSSLQALVVRPEKCYLVTYKEKRTDKVDQQSKFADTSAVQDTTPIQSIC